MKKHKGLKIALLAVGSLFGLIIVFLAGVLIFASATTLKVKNKEEMAVNGEVSTKINKDNNIKLLTWNVGYGALDDEEDCYWDGGKGVYGQSKEKVEENIIAIRNKISELDPDIFFLQELDLNSKRSYYINELNMFKETFTSDKYKESFAKNFKAGLVPLPLYQMTGRVDAGISTFSKFDISYSERIQLPIPFSWPMKLFNLKRCLLVSRIPIDGIDKELIIINLHLEAYDDGEGKAKQLEMLMNIMDEEYKKGNYVIAGGDFNQTFSTTNYGLYPKMNDWVCPVIDAESYPDFTFRMDDSTPTCRSLYKPYKDANKGVTEFQYYMIDGYIVSNNILINSLETLDLGFKNTDHNPVVMSIKLN